MERSSNNRRRGRGGHFIIESRGVLKGVHREGVHGEGVHREGVHGEGVHREGVHGEGVHCAVANIQECGN